jgi:hypothetical protein
MENDERFDGLYLNVAQQARGIEPLLDTVFSFLRRKTDFFEGPPGSNNSDDGTDAAIRKVYEVLNKHADIWRADQAKKKKQKTKPKQTKVVPAAAPANKADIAKGMEDIVELGADGGFDVSPAEKEVRKETPRPAPTVTKSAIDETTKEVEPVVESTTEVSPDSQPDEKDDKSPPPLGNGGTVEGKYTWTQTLEELCVTVPLPEGTRGRDLVVSIAKKHLKVGLKSAAPDLILNGPLVKTIICDDSFWTVEDGNRLVINLQKLNTMEWWEGVVVGDPTIDVTKIQPESSKLADLDGETRQTVEKMMFDQRQKAAGLPSSDEQKKWEMMEKFKKAHPELDFSNAKMN